MRWRSNNAFSCPVVVRVTYGGYLKGGAVYHSQTGAAIFTGVPGLRVVCPSTALDANGLLRTAIRCEDPVLFLEHKHLYRQTYNKAPNPGPQLHDPLRQGAGGPRRAATSRVVTYGAVVQRALVAAKELEEATGMSAEVIDLRSLSRWTGTRSTRRSGRPAGSSWPTRIRCSWGYGAEIAARIADEVFAWLDAPVRRVAATDTFVAYAPELEDVILPQVESPPGGDRVDRGLLTPPETSAALQHRPAEHRLRRLVQQVRRAQLVEPSSRSSTRSRRFGGAAESSTAIRPRCIMITRSP